MGRDQFRPDQKTKGTVGEIALRNFLLAEGYEITPNKRFGQYEVDVYVEDLHVALEFDGKKFHSFKKRDENRDQFLSEHFFLSVLRVTAVNTGTMAMMRVWLNQQSVGVAARKTIYRTRCE